MNYEDDVLKFMDCTASKEECDEVVKGIASHEDLENLLLADAASLLYCTDEELSEFFSPAEIAEIRRLGAVATNYGEDDEDQRMVAEEGEPYGEQ